MTALNSITVDRAAFVVSSLQDETDERSFWHSRSHGERLAAVELMRQIIYGFDPPGPRLQRVLEVVDGPPG